MERFHLAEIEDQSWCPRFIRESTTDVLLTLYNLLKIYEPAYNKIIEILEKTGVNSIIDCCSGSGGPINQLCIFLNRTGKKSTTITLTDKFPNLESYLELERRFPDQVKGHYTSLDASELPPSLKGMRTYFSSFHHFRPVQAVKILQDAADINMPIGIFELVHRMPMDFLRVLLSPFIVPLLMPLAGRMTWTKFVFTYLIPVTPFTFTWDYLASNMRAYSIKEMHALINQINAPGYKWDIGKMRSKRAAFTTYYLVGYKNSD